MLDAAPIRAARELPFDSPAQAAYLNLWRTYDRLKAFEDELFAPYDLSAQQYNALRILAAAHPEPLATSQIGARLVSRAPDMTRLLDKLAERKLVSRRRRTDNRRVVDAAITPAGLRLLEELAEPVRACHERQLGHLSRRELSQLVQLLREVRRPHEASQRRAADDVKSLARK